MAVITMAVTRGRGYRPQAARSVADRPDSAGAARSRKIHSIDDLVRRCPDGIHWPPSSAKPPTLEAMARDKTASSFDARWRDDVAKQGLVILSSSSWHRERDVSTGA